MKKEGRMMYELKNVSFRYANTEEAGAIKNINLSIHSGEAVLICGESGCGKTTLLRLLNGLIPNYFEGTLEGQVLFDQADIRELDIRDMAERVGTVFQNPKTQFFTLNTTSEIAFGCENIGLQPEDIQSRVERVIAEFKIEKLMNRSSFALSGGEKQKIACACISAMEPDVFLLDEPSSNLDAKSIQELKRIMNHWKEQGKTIIIVEHRLHYTLELVDRVIYLCNGEIAYDVKVEEFQSFTEEQMKKMGLRMIANTSHQREPKHAKRRYITLDNISYSYNKKGPLQLQVGHNVIPQNEIVAIVGLNGSGKSTFGQYLCGLLKDKNGRVTYDGKIYSAKELRHLSYLIFQDVNHQLFSESVYGEMVLGENKRFWEREENKIYIEQVLKQMNLWKKQQRHPMSLSGGEKQRVAVSSALVQRKEIFVFDEPTSGLDYRNMNGVASALVGLQARGKSIFVITHDLELIYKCCTYVVFFDDTKIRWQAPLDRECAARLEAFFGC
jgi:hypothetical protein